jgi:hypothetical protein
MASISENWSARFRSCCKKVFRGFFFFLGCALVVAHRIVWYDMAAIRDASGLVAAIEHVVSLLNGAISDRGCAIENYADAGGCRDVPKVRSEIR